MSRAQVNNGEFAFRVPPKTAFLLSAESPTQRMESPVSKEVYLGDDVVLHLVKR